MAKLSTVISGMILFILVLTGIFTFLVDGIDKYQPVNIPSDYNDSFVKIQNQINDINSISNETENDLKVDSSTNGGSSITDFLGFFFSAGYTGLQTMVATAKLNFVLINEGVNNIAGGTAYGNVLKSALMTLVMIFILIVVIMSIIFKWQT